jgi:hypothetical protein
MRSLLVLLSLPWFAVLLVVHQIVELQGQAIGGSKYFAHIGIQSGIMTEYLLGGVAVIVGALLVADAFARAKVRKAALVLSALFAAGVFYTYLAVLAPALGSFAYVPLRTFPPEFLWFPKVAIALGVLTSLLLGLRRTRS